MLRGKEKFFQHCDTNGWFFTYKIVVLMFVISLFTYKILKLQCSAEWIGLYSSALRTIDWPICDLGIFPTLYYLQISCAILHWLTRKLYADFTHQTRVRRIRNFFLIRLGANPSEYGSYSLHIRMFRYISQTPFIRNIRFIFASK
jgi:hypothetical protein